MKHDIPPLFYNRTISIAILNRWCALVALLAEQPSAAAPEPGNNYPVAVEVIKVGWRRWGMASWQKLDGKRTRWLKIPLNAVDAPSYISKTDWNNISWSTAPDENDDLRNNHDIIDLFEHGGPVYVARTT